MMESFLIHSRQPALEAANKFQSRTIQDGYPDCSIAKLRKNINFPTEASATIFLHFRAAFVSESCATLQKNPVPRQPNVKNFLSTTTLSCLRPAFRCHEIFHSIIHRALDYIPMSRKPRDGPVRLEQLD